MKQSGLIVIMTSRLTMGKETDCHFLYLDVIRFQNRTNLLLFLAVKFNMDLRKCLIPCCYKLKTYLKAEYSMMVLEIKFLALVNSLTFMFRVEDLLSIL
jgi:hypothetical protein